MFMSAGFAEEISSIWPAEQWSFHATGSKIPKLSIMLPYYLKQSLPPLQCYIVVLLTLPEWSQDAEECWTQLLYTLSQSLKSPNSRYYISSLDISCRWNSNFNSSSKKQPLFIISMFCFASLFSFLQVGTYGPSFFFLF